LRETKVEETTSGVRVTLMVAWVKEKKRRSEARIVPVPKGVVRASILLGDEIKVERRKRKTKERSKKSTGVRMTLMEFCLYLERRVRRNNTVEKMTKRNCLSASMAVFLKGRK